MDDRQEPEMILSVVRRLHADQGDSELHTIIRAARFLDVDDAVDLCNEVFKKEGKEAVDVINFEGISPKQLVKSELIPSPVIRCIMDPLGENQATAAMSLLKSLLPDATDAPDTLNNTHTPDTTNTPSTPVTPKIPATTTQPVAPVAPVVPVAPVAPVAEMNSAPSLPNTQQQGNEDKDEGICGWLTVT